MPMKFHTESMEMLAYSSYKKKLVKGNEWNINGVIWNKVLI